ncbi:MAG TPA: enoyl-CoA hydratase [Terriglobales bacterium]|nr:enoyl-CoA hydratase [Terriglobales bacterium]
MLVERDAGIAIIRLNRPEKKNALTLAMYRSLIAALEQSETDDDVRVILIAGSPDCFTAGNDLADFAAASSDGPRDAIHFLERLRAGEKPVIAAVEGLAIGIGTTLLLHCDLVYAGAGARFQLPFVNLGLCPEAGSSVILPAMVGHQRAAELLFFGEPFGAQQARDFGLINQVLPDGNVFEFAMERASQLAEKPVSALRATKALLRRNSSASVADAMVEESRRFAELLQGPDARQAMAAFLERSRQKSRSAG